MKVIDASYELVTESEMSKKIEKIARICYQSEDQICESSDVKLIGKLLERQHYAMLEHGDLCFSVNRTMYEAMLDAVNELGHPSGDEHYHRTYLRFSSIDKYLISGNLRAWIETLVSIAEAYKVLLPIYAYVDKMLKQGETLFAEYSDLVSRPFMGNPWLIGDCNLITNYDVDLTPKERIIHETFSVIFTSDRGFSHEICRMRPCSFAQESTRFCNYSLGKYGSDVTLIKPVGFDAWTYKQQEVWKRTQEAACEGYIELTNELKLPAQMARGVLPQNVKATICVTTNLYEWQHIFNLRACDATGPAHPQMKEVMCPLCRDMQSKYDFAFGHLQIAG